MTTTNTKPRTLSKHRVGSVSVTRFLTRFGGIEWFITDELEECDEANRSLFQGDRQHARRWLRIHWPAIKAGRRPRPELRLRKAWLPRGWNV